MKEILDVMQIVLAKKRSLTQESVDLSDNLPDLTAAQLADLRKREPFAEFMEQSAKYIPQTGSRSVTKQTDNITDLTQHPRFKRSNPSCPHGAA